MGLISFHTDLHPKARKKTQKRSNPLFWSFYLDFLMCFFFQKQAENNVQPKHPVQSVLKSACLLL